MSTRALVAIAVVVAAVVAAAYLAQSLQPPVAASSPTVYAALPEEEFSRLPLAVTTPRDTVVARSSPVRRTPTPAPKPKVTPMTKHLAGLATWYDDGPGLYAAAGPSLRRAIGDHWRDRILTVCSGTRCVDGVRLSDWCACGPRHGHPTVLDLSLFTFSRIGPASKGVIEVIVSWR